MTNRGSTDSYVCSCSSTPTSSSTGSPSARTVHRPSPPPASTPPPAPFTRPHSPDHPPPINHTSRRVTSAIAARARPRTNTSGPNAQARRRPRGPSPPRERAPPARQPRAPSGPQLCCSPFAAARRAVRRVDRRQLLAPREHRTGQPRVARAPQRVRPRRYAGNGAVEENHRVVLARRTASGGRMTRVLRMTCRGRPFVAFPPVLSRRFPPARRSPSSSPPPSSAAAGARERRWIRIVRNCIGLIVVGTIDSSRTNSVKCVATSAIGGVGERARNLRNPVSNPTPSAVAVPLPNSSTTHSDRPVHPLHICDTGAQSAAKDLPPPPPPPSRDAPTRVNTRSTRGMNADVAGTKEPTCARKTHAAIDLRYTLFPDWFGPVTTAMRPLDELAPGASPPGDSPTDTVRTVRPPPAASEIVRDDRPALWRARRLLQRVPGADDVHLGAVV